MSEAATRERPAPWHNGGESAMPYKGICRFPDCAKNARERGWCSAHYERWRKHGDPSVTKYQPHPLEHLHDWSVEIDANGCWIWQGIVASNGYGSTLIPRSRTRMMAHRAVYFMLVGPVSDDLDLDHLCRVPRCVNPEHLEPVTHKENMARAPYTGADWQRAKTHCPSGHEYSTENTYINQRGARECRICRSKRVHR